MRGRPLRATLLDAITIAQRRGLVQRSMNSPDRLYDLTIVGIQPITFIKLRFAPEILAALSQIIRDYREDIRRLRFVCHDATVSLELWLRSRYGTWRFFRIENDNVFEIDREGRPLGTGPVRA